MNKKYVFASITILSVGLSFSALAQNNNAPVSIREVRKAQQWLDSYYSDQDQKIQELTRKVSEAWNLLTVDQYANDSDAKRVSDHKRKEDALKIVEALPLEFVNNNKELGSS